MAGRHHLPMVPLSDVGEEPETVLPLYPEMAVIKYKAGMDSGVLVKQFKGLTRVALEAPPCSRKSVDVPAALLRSGLRKLVVHATPSRPLAASTQKYVAGLHRDITVKFVEDFTSFDSFPTDGLVMISTGVLVAFMTAWRKHGIDPHMVLFLDEMHESDAATATLRRVQTAAPGVDIYIEATATRGTGAGGFTRPDLPGTLREFSYTPQAPCDWDLSEKGKPWSCLKTSGDMLIFEDDPVDAGIICDKFLDMGCRAYRFSAKMPIDAYLRSMDEVNNPPPNVGIAVMVVDYSFRSGFTYPTVTRIIDSGQVRYMQMDRTRVIWKKRNAYLAEIHQTRNRGARNSGVECHYWLPSGGAELVSVDLEGVEFDLACLMHRMLGVKPSGLLKDGKFATGLVPRSFTRVMTGEQPVRAYKLDTPWPGSDGRPKTPPPVSPLEMNYPESVKSTDVNSVFTVDDDDVHSSEDISAEDFHRARVRRASRVRETPVDDPPPMPKIPRLDTVSGASVLDNFSKLFDGKPQQMRMEYGRYYYCNDLAVGAHGAYTSFDDIMRDMGEVPPKVYVRGLGPRTRREACALALAVYNESVVAATAASYVMHFASTSAVVAANADQAPLREWAEAVRAAYHQAEASGKCAMELLLGTTEYSFLELPGMDERERAAVQTFLEGLAGSVRTTDDAVRYRDALPTARVGYDPSGRYALSIKPGGWREKLALALLGDKGGTIDVSMTAVPGDGSGSVGYIDEPVYTTANQLAMAAGGRRYG